jgi:hypothetical protein
MPSLPPFAGPPDCSRRGSGLSEKSQIWRTGAKPLDNGDTFRRKDLHDAVRADRNEIPSPAGRPGNGPAGVRTFRLLGPLHNAAQLPAVRSQSIWMGPARVLRDRKPHVLAQNKTLLSAGARDGTLSAKRLLPDSILPATWCGRVVGRSRLWRSGLDKSDGAAGSLCRGARGSLPLARL